MTGGSTMIKVEDKDKDYIYMYSEDPNEIYKIMNSVTVALMTTYKGCPALVVRKEKRI